MDSVNFLILCGCFLDSSDVFQLVKIFQKTPTVGLSGDIDLDVDISRIAVAGFPPLAAPLLDRACPSEAFTTSSRSSFDQFKNWKGVLIGIV